ncbi:MAG: pitrilysin family protein [Alphaproteobacteria bacterium]
MPDVAIAYQSFTLSNGLRVIVSPDHKAPIVSVGIWYGVGSRDETPGRTGFAHLFEHLMFNGSEHYNDEYFRPFEQVGASLINGNTWFDRTEYFETVPNTALDLALWMESDRMGHLLGAVDQAKLDEQRGVVQNEKREGDNQPYGLVEYSMLAGLFPAPHPYSWSTIGSMDDLNAASLADVRTWFQTHYGAANAVLAIVGDVDPAAARASVERYFGDIEPGPPVARRQAAVPIHADNTRDVLRDHVPQARIYRYWAVPGWATHDSALLSLSAEILGSGKSSRLYRALVDDQKIATAVTASVEPHEIAGMFQVELTVANGVDVEAAGRALDAEMARYLASGPTQAELDRVQMSDYASFVRGVEHVSGDGGKTEVLAEGWLYGGDPNFYHTQLQWLRDARLADVTGTSQEWLRHGYHQVDVVPFGDLAATSVHADRSALPTVASTPELTFPAIQQATLPNGAKLVFARREGAPLVEILAQFDGGYVSDVGRSQGLASFASSMLDEGTTTRSAYQISDEAQRLGAQLSTGANLESSSVRLSALTSNLTPSLALMADVVRNPAFNQADIERVRRSWLAQIQQEQAQPVNLALRLLPPAIYGEGSAYGAPLTGSGTPQSINALTRADLQRFHDERIRPDNATFFVVGDMTFEQAQAALNTAFSGWRAPAGAIPAVAPSTVPQRTAPRLILIDKPDSPQSMILAGRATTLAADPTALTQEVMNDALGGLFTSRVNMNLREDKHWSYGAFTFFFNARGPRPWLVYAPVQSDKTIESITELRKELTDVRATRPITQQEFDRVRNQDIRALPGSYETSGDILDALAQARNAGRPLDWAATLATRYRAMSLADVQTATGQIVNQNDLVWIVIGDRAKIEPGLRALNLAPLEIWDDNGHPVH